MKESGFSLLELLITVVILSIGLMALSGIFPMGSRSRLKAENMTRAMELAEQKMEKLRVMGYEEIREYPPETSIYDTVGNYTRWWSYSITSSWNEDENAFFVILVDSVSYPFPGGREVIALKTHITPALH
ncbi:prepilin-type N-terminal cleavage/methylation domain-containing protein [candidate division TA06 bacterium]|nr:prepilin-type N-terminal cleavage/methylation domain-containing protein [candidate division TA06 bacterium]